jgi:uncharacterized membrane protein YfcA
MTFGRAFLYELVICFLLFICSCRDFVLCVCVGVGGSFAGVTRFILIAPLMHFTLFPLHTLSASVTLTLIHTSALFHSLYL